MDSYEQIGERVVLHSSVWDKCFFLLVGIYSCVQSCCVRQSHPPLAFTLEFLRVSSPFSLIAGNSSETMAWNQLTTQDTAASLGFYCMILVSFSFNKNLPLFLDLPCTISPLLTPSIGYQRFSIANNRPKPKCFTSMLVPTFLFVCNECTIDFLKVQKMHLGHTTVQSLCSSHKLMSEDWVVLAFW